MGENVVFIGNKPIMSYVMVVLEALSRGDADKVVLKARGQAISRAVDVAEVTKRQYFTEILPFKIEIGTEQMPILEGSGTRGVSTISIELEKAKPTDSKSTPHERHTNLTELKGVGEARAEKLKSAGFKTIESLAKSNVEKVSGKTGLSEKVSDDIIEAARNFLKTEDNG